MAVLLTARHTRLNKIEPRAKLIAVLAVVFLMFTLTNILSLAVLVGLLLALTLHIAGRSTLTKRILQAAAISYPLTLLIFALSLWDVERSTTLNALTSLHDSGAFTLRLFSVVLANLLLILTTDPRDFARSLRGWRLPTEVCILLMTVLQCLPMAIAQARRILDAQRCRGFSLGRLWNPLAWLPLGIPLLVGTLHRAETLAMSWELRGFRSGPSSMSAPDRWQARDFALAGGSILAAAIGILLG